MKKLVVILILLTSCTSKPKGPARSSASAPAQCLNWVDHSGTHPIPLKGKIINAFKDNFLQLISLKRGDVSPAPFNLEAGGIGALNKSEVDALVNGSKFLFTTRPKLDDWDNESQIGIADMRGNGVVMLAGEKNIRFAGPVFFPGARKILFVRWEGVSSSNSRLMTMELASKKITPFPLDMQGVGDPEVSYSGKMITFKGPTGTSPYGIYVANADGTGLRKLTDGYSDHDPVFSPDDKKIYFERYYGQGDWFAVNEPLWGIVEVDVATGAEKVIVPHDPCKKHFFWLPTVSPDGKYIMYVHVDKDAEREDRVDTDLWVSRIDGSHPQKVPNTDWFYYFDWTR